MKASWAPAAPAESSIYSELRAADQVRRISQHFSDQREIRTPTPNGHDVLSVACLPFHHLAKSVTRMGFEPMSRD